MEIEELMEDINPEAILTQEECERERTPEEMIKWVDRIWVLFGTNDETKNYARLRKGLSKQFLEEILPLRHVAEHKYRELDGVYLKPRIGNQNYDAEVINKHLNPPHVIRLEFGLALTGLAGYEESLRREYFVEHEYVPMSGSVCRDGTKASGGQICAKLGVEDYSEPLRKQLELIGSEAEKKATMQYSASTILCIVFSDYLPFKLERDGEYLVRYIEDRVVAKVLENFRCLFLIGSSGKFFREFGRPT